MKARLTLLLLLSLPALGLAGRAASKPGAPALRSELIFPLDRLHNHGSCVVECPNGDLLVAWYRGSGERKADDVRVLGARKRQGADRWSEPFVLADTEGFPDCNPALTVDSRKRLRLFWPLIVANEWHTAILMSKTSHRYDSPGAPEWSAERPILLKPGPEFTRLVEASVERDLARLNSFPAERREEIRQYLERRRKNAADRYFNRLGWMPRVHATRLRDGRLLLPLYSDGFDFSLVAISDDAGETWRASLPILGDGPVQPSLVERRDGTVVAFMRDNGLPPKRMLVSESKDRGETWLPARDTDVLNPGSGLEAIRLRSGRWLLVNNDTERGRHRLSVSLSEDEGRTWPWTRALEAEPPAPDATTASYPSVIQTRDGMIHVTYTYTRKRGEAVAPDNPRRELETIKHVWFEEAWVRTDSPR
jgi:predicted neuraminidase